MVSETECVKASGEGSDEVIKVALRIRPNNDSERRSKRANVVEAVGCDGDSAVARCAHYTVHGQATDSHRQDVKKFNYDHVFGPETTQELVYETVAKPVIDHCVAGYNNCIFAYGQTGAGKTHTMLGTAEQPGIIPRLTKGLFDRIAADEAKGSVEDLATGDISQTKYHVEVSYLEIYNEKVRDLLAQDAGGTSASPTPTKNRSENKSGQSIGIADAKPHSAKPLRIREHYRIGPYVEGLTSLAVTTLEEIEQTIANGNRARMVAATNMNARSSRSHAIFMLNVERRTTTRKERAEPANGSLSKSPLKAISKVDDDAGEIPSESASVRREGKDLTMIRSSRVSLVDLAGSERVSKTGAEGVRLKESGNINKSLSTLGLVINRLAEGPSKTDGTRHIPYRNSTLTWLLKDSLGGNSKTIMVAAITPNALHAEETLSTLRYAESVKKIINHAVINEDPQQRIIRELKNELAELKARLAAGDGHNSTATKSKGGDEAAKLRAKLEESESLIEKLRKPWEEKVKESQEHLNKYNRQLNRIGITLAADQRGIGLDQNKPYLINLNEDPALNELLVYHLDYSNVVGKMVPGEDLPQVSDNPNQNKPISESDVDQVTIQFNGLGIRDRHCLIDVAEDNCSITITPYPSCDADIFINGKRVVDGMTEQIYHRDRILFGNNHLYRMHAPQCPRPGGQEIGGVRGSLWAQAQRELIYNDEDVALRELTEESVGNDTTSPEKAKLSTADEEALRAEYEARIKEARESATREVANEYQQKLNNLEEEHQRKLLDPAHEEAQALMRWRARERQRLLQDLLVVMPKIRTANAIAEALHEKVTFHAKIQLHSEVLQKAGDLALTAVDGDHKYFYHEDYQEGEIVVEVIDGRENAMHVLSLDKFQERVEDMQMIYEEYQETGTRPDEPEASSLTLDDGPAEPDTDSNGRVGNPFHEPHDYALAGIAHVYLRPLMFTLPGFVVQTPIFDQRGLKRGRLSVALRRLPQRHEVAALGEYLSLNNAELMQGTVMPNASEINPGRRSSFTDVDLKNGRKSPTKALQNNNRTATPDAGRYQPSKATPCPQSSNGMLHHTHGSGLHNHSPPKDVLFARGVKQASVDRARTAIVRETEAGDSERYEIILGVAEGLSGNNTDFVFAKYHFWQQEEIRVPEERPDRMTDSMEQSDDPSTYVENLGDSFQQLEGSLQDETETIRFNSRKVFAVDPVDDMFLQYLSNGALAIELWGHNVRLAMRGLSPRGGDDGPVAVTAGNSHNRTVASASNSPFLDDTQGLTPRGMANQQRWLALFRQPTGSGPGAHLAVPRTILRSLRELPLHCLTVDNESMARLGKFTDAIRGFWGVGLQFSVLEPNEDGIFVPLPIRAPPRKPPRSLAGAIAWTLEGHGLGPMTTQERWNFGSETDTVSLHAGGVIAARQGSVRRLSVYVSRLDMAYAAHKSHGLRGEHSHLNHMTGGGGVNLAKLQLEAIEEVALVNVTEVALDAQAPQDSRSLAIDRDIALLELRKRAVDERIRQLQELLGRRNDITKADDSIVPPQSSVKNLSHLEIDHGGDAMPTERLGRRQDRLIRESMSLLLQRDGLMQDRGNDTGDLASNTNINNDNNSLGLGRDPPLVQVPTMVAVGTDADQSMHSASLTISAVAEIIERLPPEERSLWSSSDIAIEERLSYPAGHGNADTAALNPESAEAATAVIDVDDRDVLDSTIFNATSSTAIAQGIGHSVGRMAAPRDGSPERVPMTHGASSAADTSGPSTAGAPEQFSTVQILPILIRDIIGDAGSAVSAMCSWDFGQLQDPRLHRVTAPGHVLRFALAVKVRVVGVVDPIVVEKFLDLRLVPWQLMPPTGVTAPAASTGGPATPASTPMDQHRRAGSESTFGSWMRSMMVGRQVYGTPDAAGVSTPLRGTGAERLTKDQTGCGDGSVAFATGALYAVDSTLLYAATDKDDSISGGSKTNIENLKLKSPVTSSPSTPTHCRSRRAQNAAGKAIEARALLDYEAAVESLKATMTVERLRQNLALERSLGSVMPQP
eukprot:Clim_evm40s202 gene=Clim_evmTU40s202